MFKNMGPYLVIAILLVACGEKKSIRPGSSKASLIEVKGSPLKTEKFPSAEVLTYKNEEKFQINKDKVTTIFRTPTGDEKNLIFWRHQFRDCATSERALNDEPMPEIEFSCPTLGKSVIYVKGTGKVVRVTDYEI